MDRKMATEQILRTLSDYWRLHKTAFFLSYLMDTFGVTPQEYPRFDCLYIAEAEDGDLAQGWIGGLIKRWWIVDDNGTRPTSRPHLPILLDEPDNLRADFYPKPVIKFYFADDRITFGESFGPSYVCRKTAKLVFNNDGTTTFGDSHTIWTSVSPNRNI